MPVRERYKVTKTYKLESGRTYSLTLLKEEYDNIERLKSLIPEHNKNMQEVYVSLLEKLPQGVNLIVRSFRKVNEFVGKEFFSIRNYLSKEIVEVVTRDGIIRGFISETEGDFNKLVELIIDRFNKKEYINEQKQGWSRKEETITSNEERVGKSRDTRKGVIRDFRARLKKCGV